jgi:hypothetical protein
MNERPAWRVASVGRRSVSAGIGDCMLVDESHLGWFFGSILVGIAGGVLFIAVALGMTAGYTAGNVVATWFLVIAGGLMIYASVGSWTRTRLDRLRLRSPGAFHSVRLAAAVMILVVTGALLVAVVTTARYTAASVVGIWFGVVALALLIYTALLSAVRLSPSRLQLWSPQVRTRLGLAVALLVVGGFVRWMEPVGWQTLGRWTQVVLTVIALALAIPVLTRVGPRRTWLRGHLWMGLLSGWFVVLHSGFGLGGLLEQVLWVLLVLTLLTGIYGLALQQRLPGAITDRFPAEVPVGQHAHACRLLRAEAETAVKAVCGQDAAGAASSPDDDARDARRAVSTQYQAEVHEFLTMPYNRRSLLADPLQAEGLFAELQRGFWRPQDRDHLKTIQDICEQRRILGEQERLHGRLHRWLWWHIPLSSALIALAVVHALASLWY